MGQLLIAKYSYAHFSGKASQSYSFISRDEIKTKRRMLALVERSTHLLLSFNTFIEVSQGR